MSVRRNYSCDLCGYAITETNGIGIIHKAGGAIQAVWLHKEGAGRHLCNSCITGLRAMLSDLDRTAQIHAELDAASVPERSGVGGDGAPLVAPDVELGPGRNQ